MKEKLKQIIKDLDNAVNLLSGVYNGLDNLEHEESEIAYQIYIDGEELQDILQKTLDGIEGEDQ